MGLMQWGIKRVYLDLQSVPFVSSWFVLMCEPNPAKADYTCIKFLKIAVFLIPRLQWKCNGSSLQKHLQLCLCRKKRGWDVRAKWRTFGLWCFKKKIFKRWWYFFVRKLSKKKTLPHPWGRKKLIAKTADIGYKRACAIDCALWPK